MLRSKFFVRRGRWVVVRDEKHIKVVCSECGASGKPELSKCPVCQAKMDGVNDG